MNIETVGSFGDWLRAARHRRRLSQEELADRAGVSVRTVRNLESGSVRAPHPSSVRRLYSALGIDPDVAGRGAPSTMPADIGDFVGRERDLVLIGQALVTDRPQLPILGLFGQPGVGKTVLAVHAAHQLREHFGDGQFYLNLGAQDGPPAPPFAALGRLLSALGVDRHGMPENEPRRAELFRQLVADRRMLFVLDDVVDAAQVRPLLPGTAGCAVVVVSRRRLVELEGVSHRSVERFSVAEALLLLERMLGTERVAAEREPARSLLGRCDYLPLAVRIAGAKLTGRPHRSLAWLAGQLDRTGGRLETLTSGELAVRSTLMSAYQALDDTARLALRVLAELTMTSCAPWTVAAALDLPADRATDLLDRLAEASLVQPPVRDDAGQDRYQIHDLVREFAVERVEVEDPPAEARRRVRRAVAAAWSRVAAATVHLDDEAAYGDQPQLPAGPPPPAAYEWLRVEAAGLVELLELACRRGLVTEAWGLARGLLPYFDTDRCDDLMEHACRALLDAARRHHVAAAEACALIGLADVHQIRGRRRDALATMELAHEAAGRGGSARTVAVTEHLIASTHRLLGEHDQARTWIERATVHARALHDEGLVVAVCWQEAAVQALTADRDPHRAVALLRQASSARLSGRRAVIASMRFAQAYRALGVLAEAKRHLVGAIDAGQALPDHVGAAYLRLELAELQRACGAFDTAKRTLVEARRALATVGRPTGEVIAARRLAQMSGR